MPSSLSKTPEEALLALIQEKSNIPVTWNDFMTVFPPVALPADHPSGKNSEVTVRTSMDSTHAGRVSFQYDRYDLAELLLIPMSATIEDVGTFANYLTALNARYGIDLESRELAPVLPFDVSGGELSYQVLVRAAPNALRLVGEGYLTVSVNWRLDDPERVEIEAERLYRLVNITIPSSLDTLFS